MSPKPGFYAQYRYRYSLATSAWLDIIHIDNTGTARNRMKFFDFFSNEIEPDTSKWPKLNQKELEKIKHYEYFASLEEALNYGYQLSAYDDDKLYDKW